MDFIKKYWIVLSLIGIGVLFFALRFYNILSLPIFTDEAIYIRWAQIAKQDAAWRFISLTDGKQPSFIWAMMIPLKFIKDPLLAGRTVSVVAGFLSLIGLFILTREVFKNTKIALTSVALFALYPFALVYDRLALYESMVTLFSIWSLYFLILLVRKARLDTALILGMVLGGSVLTKSSGFLSIYLSPLLLILFDTKRKLLKERFFKWVLMMGVAVVSTYVYYSVQRLSPFFHIIAEKNATFVYPFSIWIHHPLQYFYSNFHGLTDWLITYMTIPIFLLSLVSFVLNYKKNYREKIFLFLWFLGPFMALTLFGNKIYPRFVYFMSIPLLILASYSLYTLILRFKNIYIRAFIFIGFVALMVRSDIAILTHIATAPIPVIDKEQFINGWPAGGGVRESVEFFRNEAAKGKITIATEGTFGLMPFSYEMYLVSNPNVTIKGLWPIGAKPPKELTDVAKKMPVYVVFYQPCPGCMTIGTAPLTWNVKVIQSYRKEATDNYLTVYQLQAE